MDIKELKEEFRKIAGGNVSPQTLDGVFLDITDLKEEYRKLTGDRVSPQTLRRWADEDIITDHRDDLANIATTGRGHAEYWSPQALWEAAAVWAVNKVAGKRLPYETIKEIRIVAQQVFRTPEAVYQWSPNVVFSGPTPSDPSDQPGYRVLKMKFHENILDLFYRLIKLRGYERPMLGDERLNALLEDEEVVSLLDRWIEHHYIGQGDPDALAKIWHAIAPVLIGSPRVFELARTWVAAFVKAQKGEPLSQPKKVVFHWRSLGRPEWIQLYMITLEEPDPIVSVLADFEDYDGTSYDEREDEDEIVIFFDEVDVRKKVFYAPFDRWDSSLTSRLSLPQRDDTQGQRPMRPTDR
jgi:hypothetical protein